MLWKSTLKATVRGGQRAQSHSRRRDGPGPTVAGHLQLADLKVSAVVGVERALLNHHPMHGLINVPLVEARGLLQSDLEAPLPRRARVEVRHATRTVALFGAVPAPAVTDARIKTVATAVGKVASLRAHDRPVGRTHRTPSTLGAARPAGRVCLGPSAKAEFAVVTLQLVVLVSRRALLLFAATVGRQSRQQSQPKPTFAAPTAW